MYKFSKKSKAQLSTCHPLIQNLFNEVVKSYDCTIIEGHRNREAQEAAFAAGKSQLHWPRGNHNKVPSLAVDVAPYPIQWENIQRFREFAFFVKDIAKHLDINVQWGGDWPKFKDYVHWEIVNTIQKGSDYHD